MKKLLLVGAVAVVALAASSQARAGVSFSISLGHHFPHAPVVVAPPPVVVAPPVAVYPGHCAPAPVVVAPAACAPVHRHYVKYHAYRDHRCDRHCDDRAHRHGYRQSGHGYAAGYGQGAYAYGNGGGLRVVANGHRH